MPRKGIVRFLVSQCSSVLPKSCAAADGTVEVSFSILQQPKTVKKTAEAGFGNLVKSALKNDMVGMQAEDPIAWQHINLHGRYEFQKQPDPLNVDAIIRQLTELFVDRNTALAA
jgi:hypothetical protein